MTHFEDFYPLSPVQQGMLFHSLYAEDAAEYVLQLRLRLSPLDPEIFRRAWERVIAHHPVLRTAFLWERVKRPVQVVYRNPELNWQNEDWSGLSPDDRTRQLAGLCCSELNRGFRLDRAPLMRMRLIAVGDGVWEFVWTKHHGILDGWSASLVLSDVLRAYRELRRGGSPDLGRVRPYRDYIDWLQRQDLASAENYWRNALADFHEPSVLPIASGAKSHRYSAIQIEFSSREVESIQQFCRRAHLTAGTVIQGAWAIVLSSYCSTTDVVFGVTTSGRPAELTGIERMAGVFINTLPARAQMEPGSLVTDWLSVYQRQQAEARQYGFSPPTNVRQWSGVKAGTPLFDMLVVFENYPEMNWTDQQEAPKVLATETHDQTSYGLSLMGRLSGSNLGLELVYDNGEFWRTRMLALARHYRNTLLSMTSRPDVRLAEVDLLSGAERRTILHEWNATACGYGSGTMLPLLDEHRDSHEIALEAGETRLSYEELHRRADAVAQQLVQMGVGPDSRVGVALDRSPEMVIALLAVWKAGGAYVPLDPGYPLPRLRYMAADAEISVLIASRGRMSAWAGFSGAILVPGETAVDSLERSPHVRTLGPDNLAYIIYTSGSTGNPKGVMITHGAIRNRLLWMRQACQTTAADLVLQKAPISFDVSVWELFLPLIAGARLILAEPDGHKDPNYLTTLIADRGVTMAHFVPSMLNVWLKAPLLERCVSLRAVICSGEALSGDLRDRFHSRLKAQLLNYYGPTEAAVDVTSYACEPGDRTPLVPIGKPIANTTMYVLDSWLRPQPPEVPGDLYIGGAALARGYYNRPGLTADRFVPDPYGNAPGARLYRTGDIAAYLPDGNLMFAGRCDAQVKVRGVRVELGEIETVLRQHSQVESAAVTAVVEDGEARLAAWVVLKPAATAGTWALRAWLRECLPEVMVPAAIVLIPALPLLPNGKLDQRALSSLAAQNPAPDYVAPATSLESSIAAIWREVLHRDEIGVTTSFFELGGHSLLSIELHQRLRTSLGINIALADLFRFPTIASLAAHVTQQKGEDNITASAGERLLAGHAGRETAAAQTNGLPSA